MQITLPRTLNPATNAPGYVAAAGAVYAAAVMIYNAYHHHGIIDVPVLVAAIAAVAALFTRTVVTPVSDPRDGAGRPLVPVQAGVTATPGTASSGTVRVIPPGPDG